MKFRDEELWDQPKKVGKVLPKWGAFRLSAVYTAARRYGYKGWVGDPAVRDWFLNEERENVWIGQDAARSLFGSD